MGAIDSTRKTIRLALGLACIQACEYREPKPLGEPGMTFNPLQVQDRPDKPPTPIRCHRQGDNYLGACCASRCPIAAELEPKIGHNLLTTAADKMGVPQGVREVAASVGQLLLGGKKNGQP